MPMTDCSLQQFFTFLHNSFPRVAPSLPHLLLLITMPCRLVKNKKKKRQTNNRLTMSCSSWGQAEEPHLTVSTMMAECLVRIRYPMGRVKEYIDHFWSLLKKPPGFIGDSTLLALSIPSHSHLQMVQLDFFPLSYCHRQLTLEWSSQSMVLGRYPCQCLNVRYLQDHMFRHLVLTWWPC